MNKSLEEKLAIKLRPSDFEEKIRQIWLKERIYQPEMESASHSTASGHSHGKGPFYNLMMFPYPSAEGLHVGNVYAFTGADIYGRFMRMRGYDVFEPIGLDGFGIHSENYAIKLGKHPKVQAKISENNFYRQLLSIGNGFAWENRLETYDPDYYKWTQWIFVQMFKHGLAYRKKSAVNFCPKDKTVLSDEQVIDGACERCGTMVEKREMEQWFFRITKYAERLLQNTYKQSFKWSDKVKTGQRNWIGKKEGINITYPVVSSAAGPRLLRLAKPGRQAFQRDPGTSGTQKSSGSPQAGLKAQPSAEKTDIVDHISCFTTRPDTNFGATFVVLAIDHEFVQKLLSGGLSMEKAQYDELKAYVEKTKKTSERDRIALGRKKTGVFTGYYAVNQLNNYPMPIYVTDFVLGHVGTGAVVGSPGHDIRDFEFAQKFHLEIIRVVVGKDGDKSPVTRIEQVQEEDGYMVNSGFLNGVEIHKAIPMMMDYLVKKGWAKRVVTYKLRDWCISRQRYWGAPIPMVYCGRCASEGKSWFSSQESSRSEVGGGKWEVGKRSGKQEIGSKNLTSQFSISPHTSNFSLLDSMPGWYPIPEDQLPVLLPDLTDWKPEGTGKGPLAKLKDWVNVTCPECGGPARRETDVCDTFLDSSWYHLRYPSVNAGNSKFQIQNSKQINNSKSQKEKSLELDAWNLELPWDRQITRRWLPVNQYIGGAEHTVLHLLYARFVSMALKDFGFLDFEEPYSAFFAHGLIIKDGAKMSKSKGNVVVPDEYIRAYGADTLRTYLMFLGPFEAGGDFRDSGIAGMYKFLSRVWRLVLEVDKSENKQSDELTAKEGLGCLNKQMHKTIKAVTEDIARFHYNTAIAKLMQFVNEISNYKLQITNEHVRVLLLLLAPFAPYMTEELYQRLFAGISNFQFPCLAGRQANSKLGKLDQFQSIHLQPWPVYKEEYLKEDMISFVIQVNGKVIGIISVKGEAGSVKKEMEELALESGKVKKYIDGKKVVKVVFVPGKLINFVV